MNKQEIFDKVATHLLTQKAQSRSSGGFCAYRGPDGTKCAIGCLIPDDLYTRDMEGKSVYGLINHFPSMARLLGVESIHDDPYCILRSLQQIHDHSSPQSWFRELEACALTHSLSSDVLQEFKGE